MAQSDIGLIGLAVMGQNLVLNMADHGFSVAVFNRTGATTEKFLGGEARGKTITGAYTLEEFVGQLKSPRRVMLMVKAGQPVDDFIEKLIPLLGPGDVIIDGGNSNYLDSIRRTAYVESRGLYFIGTGVSGGEEGARHGPSIMPGGSPQAWPLVKEIFQAIAAKVDGNIPCCDWVGSDGAGHFVKMVHNGIEYCDMQLIAEAYHLMRAVLGLSSEEIAGVFSRWNQGRLNSYLIEISADIFAFKDPNGSPLVEAILDAAGQKGTGRWTAETALQLGVPLTGITEAVMARSLSALKQERVEASRVLAGPSVLPTVERDAFLADLEQAVYAAKILSYTQGYMLMREAAREFHWDLNYGGVALMWRGGCIIRSAFLGKIKDAYDQNPDLQNLVLDPYFRSEIDAADRSWRSVAAAGLQAGVPVPVMASTLTFFDGYRSAWLPANLTQAQRDYFGAHTYERVDAPRGQFFHTDWTGQGGDVTSGTYQA